MQQTAAQTVIVGGGALGCAIAWQLARRGAKEVLLIEQGEIASGTSGQGAGLIGQVRSSVSKTQLIMQSRQVISELHAQGFDTGWQPSGSLRLSLSAARDAEFERHLQVAQAAGLDAEIISLTAAQAIFPSMAFTQTNVRHVLWCPSDGYVSAPKLTHAYAAAAQALGVRVQTGVALLDIQLQPDGKAIRSVQTSVGEIRCEQVVIAVGAMAARVAERVGLHLPIVPVRHQALITAPVPGIQPNLPVVRIPDARTYLRPFEQSLLIGAFTESAISQDPGVVGAPYPQARLDQTELAWMLTAATPFLPALQHTTITQTRAGLPTFTPDGVNILGPVPGIRGLHLAVACQAYGISGSGSLSALVAEALLQPVNLFPLIQATSADRWQNVAWDWAWAQQQSEQILQNYYTVEPTPAYDKVTR